MSLNFNASVAFLLLVLEIFLITCIRSLYKATIPNIGRGWHSSIGHCQLLPWHTKHQGNCYTIRVTLFPDISTMPQESGCSKAWRTK